MPISRILSGHHSVHVLGRWKRQTGNSRLTGNGLRFRLSGNWRDGRVAEGGGLLNRYTVKSRIGGSNPPLSAILDPPFRTSSLALRPSLTHLKHTWYTHKYTHGSPIFTASTHLHTCFEHEGVSLSPFVLPPPLLRPRECSPLQERKMDFLRFLRLFAAMKFLKPLTLSSAPLPSDSLRFSLNHETPPAKDHAWPSVRRSAVCPRIERRAQAAFHTPPGCPGL
jgi:hypothetical protein